MNDDALEALRARCLALPEATERPSHGHPAWFVRDKSQFAVFTDSPDGRETFWCAAPAGVQEELIASEPERFFRPPYVGHRGWLGVRLDVAVDWAEVTEIVTDAYRTVAPKTLAARLNG